MRLILAWGALGAIACWGCSGGSLQGVDGGGRGDVQMITDTGPAFDAPAFDAPIADGRPTIDAPVDRPPVDGGGVDTQTDGPSDGVATLTGRRSFVVTATFGQSPDGGTGGVPLGSGHRFTMVVDFDQRTAILGSNGTGGSVRFQPGPPGLYTIAQSITFSLGTGLILNYQMIIFSVDAMGVLHGTGQGQAVYLPPTTDVGSSTVVASTLSGVPDTEPPIFAPNLGSQVGPFDFLAVTASEPLPPDTHLTLVNLHGDRIDLAPLGAGEAAFAFEPSPFRMWRYNDQYSLLTDGVADFAGNAAIASFIFTTAAPPPLVAEDGFESASGAMLAGAQVLSGAGAPTISGTRSLYIPPIASIMAGTPSIRQLMLRLALDPGDTVIRFTYRTVLPVGASSSVFAPASFTIGSEGGQVVGSAPTLASEPSTTATIASSNFALGPIMTAELALPPDAAGEITLVRTAPGGGNLPGRPVMGLILDDLRAE